MAVIDVLNNYSIDIDSNGDHEARLFMKMITDKDGNEKPSYRSVGHYTDVSSALNGIYKDMCISKAGKKDKVSVAEWIKIVKETANEMNKIIKENV